LEALLSLVWELEIKTLLEQYEAPEVVAEKLVELFEDQEERSEESAHELCRFLLNCGLYQNLIRFCLHHLSERGFRLPWSYFIQAITQGLPDLEEDVVKFIERGIDEENATNEVARAQGAERFVKNTIELRTDQRVKLGREVLRKKNQMMEELVTLRTQQLYEQEKIMLGKLQRMFPGDQEIVDEVREHKERYALDVLARRSPMSRNTPPQEPALSPEMQEQLEQIKKALQEAAGKFPDLAFDFAVAAFMLDESATSLAIIEKIPRLSENQKWFLIEVKLRCRHFLEVLADLNAIEVEFALDPETFFASAYLRAQAYWGLDQRHMAIDILENIMITRPHYRSASALLDLWRRQ
jgi:hypothetical protein